MHPRSFFRSGHPPTLFSAFLYFDISFMVWVLIGALGIYIAKDFGLSAGMKGLLVAIPILGGSLFRVPMGILSDRIGPKKTGMIGQLVVLLPLLWGWRFGHDLPQVMVLGLLLGVAGASFAVALPLASRWYPPQHQGLAMGIAGAGNSGTVLASLFAPRLAEVVGWHGVFGFALIPVILTLGVYLALAQDSQILAYTQGDSDNPVTLPVTPAGEYRVDFPLRDAAVRLDAGVPVEVWVLVWSTNSHAPCPPPARPHSYLCKTLDSDLAVVFNSDERDSHLVLGTS